MSEAPTPTEESTERKAQPTPSGAGSSGAVTAGSRIKVFGKSALLLIIALWCLIPFFWMVMTSLKIGDRALNHPSPFEGPFGLQNYRAVFGLDFHLNLWNSFVVASVTTLLCIVIGALAAYAIARLPIRGKLVLLSAVLAVSLFPSIALVPPLYEFWRELGWLNTYRGLFIPYTAFTLPLTIFVLVTFFSGIPKDLEEAARVDGATPFQAFYKIIMPLAAPGIASIAIIVFVLSFNEFLLASTFAPRNPDQAQTVPVAIAGFTGAVPFQRPIGTITAACVIVTIPMIVAALVFQRRIVSGLTAGGVKG